jgi:hypothetical protein
VRTSLKLAVVGGVTALVLALAVDALGRPPIRRAFFNVYPSAEGTRLDDLPSNAGHCGACHYDFGGGGPRNAFGAKVEVAINSGLYTSTEDAVASLDLDDSDNDGHANHVEITDYANFTNTPTFPGLKSGDEALVSNVTVSDIVPYLTPMGSTDTTPPMVTVVYPNGGETVNAHAIVTIQ